MKKLILSVTVIALLAGKASAQYFVEGAFNFITNSTSYKSGSASTDGPSSYRFGIRPSVGYELDDKLSVGAAIGLNLYGSKTPSSTGLITSESSRTTFEIAPFVRYNLLEMSNVKVFGQASVGLEFGGGKNTMSGGGSVPSTTNKTSVFNFNMGINPGVSYKFSDNIAIEAFLGGLYLKNEKESDDNNNSQSDFSFGLNLYTSLGLGFIYKF